MIKKDKPTKRSLVVIVLFWGGILSLFAGIWIPEYSDPFFATAKWAIGLSVLFAVLKVIGQTNKK